MNWAYGVMTVPKRRDVLLPRTLASLARAGFDKPRLFVDGINSESAVPWWFQWGSVTPRVGQPIGAWGNYILALYELYIRNPVCERYVVFQDDILACRDLREYLDSCVYPDGKDGRPPGFWNLVTMRSSEWAVSDRGVYCGWIEGGVMVEYGAECLQKCSGALGLVFNRRAVGILLGAPSVVVKPISADRPERNIDGAVVTAMNLYRRDPQTGEQWVHGWREYVHGPSLLDHTGMQSVVKEGKEWQKGAATFQGEGWSALEMMKRNRL